LTHIVQQNGLGKSSAVSKKEESETEIQKACAECEKEKNQSLEEKDVIQRKEVDQTKSPQATLSTTSTTETSTSVTKTDSNSSNSSTSEKQPVEAENSQKGDEEEKKSASAASVAIPSQTPKTETQDAAASENSSASNPIAEKVQTKTGEEDVKLPKEAGATGEKAEKGQEEKSAPNTKLTEVPEAQALEQSVSNSQEVVPEVGSDPSTQQIATETAKAQGEAQTQQTELAATNAKVAQLASTGIDFGEPETEGDDASMVISPKGEAGGNHRPVLEQQRVNSSNQASAFLATAATKVQTITGLGENVPARVLAAAENAKATILTNVAQQKAAITAQMAQLRSQAQTEVQATLTQIQTQQQAANAGITQTTTTAKTKLEGEFTKANSTLAQKETSQAAKIEQLYQQALPKYKAAGEKIGNEAIALAENKAKGYEAKITGKDDSLLDGPLTDNRNKASAKAAREVGKQYKQGLVEEANKQGEKAQDGKAKDLEAVKQIANQSRQTLESQHQANLESLTSAEQTASSQIEQANTSLTQAAQKTLEATLQSLSQKEQSQLQTLTEYGQQQVTAIDGNAQKAIASLQQGINQAATSLQAALENFQAQSQGMGAPDPTALSASLAQASGQIDQAIAQVQAQLETHLGAGEQGLTQAGQNAVTSLNTISNGGIQEAQAVGTGLTTSVQQLSQSAGETFNKIQESHKTTVQTTTDTAIAGFTQVTQGIETAFNQTNQNLEQGITNSVTQLETGLRGALDKMSADINKYAKEAADQEQPRWKGVLKILLMIAVIVVVALVAGPAVIGAVGAMAGALGASAAAAGVIGAVVGGAIVGAAAGAVTQMGNNLIDGKNLMEGVGQAALIGAIGGALGGAGNALGQHLAKEALKQSAGMATQSLLKFGIETGFDTVGNILGDLVSGNPITFESVMTSTLQGIGMSLAMSGAGKIKAVEATQTKFSDIGANFGTSVGSKIKTGFSGGIDTPTTTPHVDTPNVKQPEIEVKAPEAEVKSPATEVKAPEAEVKSPATEVKAPEAEVKAPTTEFKSPATEVKAPETEVKAPATEVKAPEVEVKPPANNEPDTPNGRTTHADEPEVEPGIVAKEATADGHEIKVLKDGRVVKCSECGEIRQKYAEQLEQNPELKNPLDEIENPNESVQKVKQATQLDQVLGIAKDNPEHLFGFSEGKITVNNQIDIHPQKLKELASQDLQNLLSATKELQEKGGKFEDVSPDNQTILKELSTSDNQRLRFDYQLKGQVDRYLADMGIANNQLFQNMSTSDRNRVFDLVNEPKTYHKEAAQYALSQNPKNPSEFVNHVQFYKANIQKKVDLKFENYYKLKNEKVQLLEQSQNGRQLSHTETQNVEKQLSKELYGEEIFGKKNIKKKIQQTVLKKSGHDDVQTAYQELAKTLPSDKIGSSQIKPELSRTDKISVVKELDDVKFSSESTAVYHAEKHYQELPLSHRQGDGQINNYLNSASKTIKSADKVDASFDQYGNEVFVFHKSYTEGEKPAKLKAIVKVTPDGKIILASYLQDTK